jgi:DNA adenine methylase
MIGDFLFQKNPLPPVIKWTGSKRPVARLLGRLIPDSAERYIEPFVGGGAVLPFRKTFRALAGDIIPELIALWKAIQTAPERTAQEYRNRWNRLQKDGYTVYYEIRDNFNETKNEYDFLFLTRTCVNGLIRYNAHGAFNNSFHFTRPGIHPDRLERVIQQWSSILTGVSFHCADYRTLLQDADSHDVVFLDPPYGGARGRYTQQDISFPEFCGQIDRLNRAGAKWILTFDGRAGSREYHYAMPQELYKTKLEITTGLSPFTKLMKTSADEVFESAYMNFEVPSEFLTQNSKDIDQEGCLFSAVNM